ncbi:helix-turn-helix domain-containing protein [Schnuerera sp.]|uniref:helix-turn-helix domain-containing protein n=1 Tax=Schnuerera sp. TaxID=2794844 RepID=UPI002CE4DADB|nr:helix-turn-helix domain-containing protein [Schnuerera sp.]HSH35253.1 helix-turn-helix domain-containing protein [Schnuerera sp.]
MVKISKNTKSTRNPYDLNIAISDVERNMIIKALEVTGNNRGKVARLLYILRING